jgi:integrase
MNNSEYNQYQRYSNPYEQITQRSSKSVPTRFAQTTTPCAKLSKDFNQLITAAFNFFTNSSVSNTEKAIAWLQFQEGLRISEVLDVSPADILSNDSILIRAKKHSDNKIVTPARFQDFWLNYKKSKVAINETYNRFYFYRLYKKHNIYLNISTSQKASVTHSFRHLLIKRLQSENIDRETRARHLGHKNSKNQIYYENE